MTRQLKLLNIASVIIAGSTSKQQVIDIINPSDVTPDRNRGISIYQEVLEQEDKRKRENKFRFYGSSEYFSQLELYLKRHNEKLISNFHSTIYDPNQYQSTKLTYHDKSKRYYKKKKHKRRITNKSRKNNY